MATLERSGGGAPSLKYLSALVPLLTGLFGAFLANIPISLLGGVPPPLLALVPIYFWCLVRPDLMTPAAALAIGFGEDLLSGGAPGVWTLSFVLAYAVVARQRESFAGLSGLAAMLGFSMAAATACLVAWLTISVLHGGAILVGPIVSELAMTVLFYTPTVYVVSVIHRKLVGAARGDI